MARDGKHVFYTYLYTVTFYRINITHSDEFQFHNFEKC